MSYARWSEQSDVYVYADIRGYLNCCGCHLHEPLGSFYAFTTQDMLDHLDEHRAAGHTVPEYCYAGLERDREENDKWLEEEASDD